MRLTPYPLVGLGLTAVILSACGVPRLSTTTSPTISRRVVSLPPVRLWAALKKGGIPLQGLVIDRHGSSPFAVAWAYPRPNSPAFVSLLRVERLRWFNGTWRPTGFWTFQNTNQVEQVDATLAPDNTLGLASLWVSGGSDGAGGFLNLVVSPTQFQAKPFVPVLNPVLSPVQGYRWIENASTTRIIWQWRHGRWQETNQGLFGTIPPQATRIPWSLSSPSSLSQVTIGAEQPVAFIPASSLLSQSWAILGPFSSSTAALAAATTGLVAAYQQVPGLVAYPPLGTSYWVVGIWNAGGTGMKDYHIIAITAR